MSLGPAGVFPLESRRGGEGSSAEASATCFGTSLGWEVSVEPAASTALGPCPLPHLGRVLSPCRQLTDRLSAPTGRRGDGDDRPQIIKRAELAPPPRGLCRALVLLGSPRPELLAEKSGPQPHWLAATESARGCRGLRGAGGRRQGSPSFPGSLGREGGD